MDKKYLDLKLKLTFRPCAMLCIAGESALQNCSFIACKWVGWLNLFFVNFLGAYRSTIHAKSQILRRVSLITSIFLLNFIASNAISSPALENDRASYKTFEQANGSVIIVKSRGDARFHWFENKTGKVIIKNTATGNYEYAAIEEERGKSYLVPSGIEVITDDSVHNSEVGNSSLANGKRKEFVPLTSEDLLPLRKAALKKQHSHKPSAKDEAR